MKWYWSVSLEILGLCALGYIYYLFQKRRIHLYVAREKNAIMDLLIIELENRLASEQDQIKSPNKANQILFVLLDKLKHAKGSGKLGLGQELYKDIIYALDADDPIREQIYSLKAAIDEEEKQLHHP